MELENFTKKNYDGLIMQMIEIEKEKSKTIKNIKDLEVKQGIPYLRFATLCRWEHYEEVHRIFCKWRKGITYVPSDSPDCQHGKLIFDFEVYSLQNILRDLAHLINHEALNCSMKEFARFIVEWTNLGDSEDNVYMQLRRYKDNYK